jgi:hypothetical protein
VEEEPPPEPAAEGEEKPKPEDKESNSSIKLCLLSCLKDTKHKELFVLHASTLSFVAPYAADNVAHAILRAHEGRGPWPAFTMGSGAAKKKDNGNSWHLFNDSLLDKRLTARNAEGRVLSGKAIGGIPQYKPHACISECLNV